MSGGRGSAVTDAVGRAPVARGPVGLLGAGTAVLLLAVAARYGPHRDEMYFVRVAARPRGATSTSPRSRRCSRTRVDALTGGSLVGLRDPSALMAGLVVVLTGLLAAEFGGGRRAQVVAAASAAVSSFLLATAHLLSTTTVDLLVWTLLTWLVVRALRDGGPVWLAVGAAAGIGLQNKLQPAFLLGALLIGVLAVGPRARSGRGGRGWAAAVALALWAPNLVWQAAHGFPHVRGRGVDRGGRLGEQPALVPVPAVPVVLVSPLLVPVWALGLVAARPGPGARHVAGVRARVGAAGGRVHGDRRQAVLRRGPLPGAAGGGRRAGGGVDPAIRPGAGVRGGRWRSRWSTTR